MKEVKLLNRVQAVLLLYINRILVTIQHRDGRIFLVLINSMKPCYHRFFLDFFGEKKAQDALVVAD